MSRNPVSPLLGEGLSAYRLVVPAPHVMLVKATVEAYEGLAVVFAERGGELTLAYPPDREQEFVQLLEALDEVCASAAVRTRV